jgi:carnosine synthase
MYRKKKIVINKYIQLVCFSGKAANKTLIVCMMLQMLASKSGHVPHWPTTSSYASEVHQLCSRSDIEDAESHVTFPCVMKLEYGSSAVGVSLVHDVSECHRDWTSVQEQLRGENSHPGIGLGHGKNMLLMEYVSGTEHDVDVIMYR